MLAKCESKKKSEYLTNACVYRRNNFNISSMLGYLEKECSSWVWTFLHLSRICDSPSENDSFLFSVSNKVHEWVISTEYIFECRVENYSSGLKSCNERIQKEIISTIDSVCIKWAQTIMKWASSRLI